MPRTTRFVTTLLGLAICIASTANAFGQSTGLDQDDVTKAEIVQKLKTLSKLNTELTDLENQLSAAQQKLGPGHAQSVAIKQKLAKASNYAVKTRQELGNLKRIQAYEDVQASLAKLGASISKLQPLTSDEKGLLKAVEMAQRTLNEIKVKRAAAMAIPIVKKQTQSKLADEAEKLRRERIAHEATIAKYKKLLAQRQDELAVMNAAITQAQADRDALTQKRVLAAAAAQQLLAKEKQASVAAAAIKAAQKAKVAAEVSASTSKAGKKMESRIDRVERELAEIKLILKKIADRLPQKK